MLQLNRILLIKRINLIAVLVALVVIGLGAFTRLTDAGLGCPDWPGCYGFLSVPDEVHEIALAEVRHPERPVEAHKAWNEMIHRYVAGTLGLIIAAIFFLSLTIKGHRLIPTLAVILVIFQAWLGMLTVTLNLMPMIVMGHLLGGFSLFCLLLLNYLRLSDQNSVQIQPMHEDMSTLKQIAWITAAAVFLQIALGGWTAANYAAVACTQLPVCEGDWSTRFSLLSAFSVPLDHQDYEYGVLPYEARMSIHVMHRIGAMIASAFVIILAVAMWRKNLPNTAKLVPVIGVLLVCQILLGISNVMWQLPLLVAVGHNLMGLLLLSSVVASLYFIHQNSVARIKES